jgi:phosphoglycerate dehydrogenase-like enzyme
MHSPATGVRRLLHPALRASAVVLTCSRSVHAPAMADQVMAWVLAHARRLPALWRAQGERRWAQEEVLAAAPPQSLRGRTMLLVGYGAAGRELAVRARPFGLRLVGVRRRIDDGGDLVDRMVPPERVEEALAAADVVVNLLPHTDDTRGFFGEGRFAAMRPGACFINVGRGATVDEAALAAALAEGRLGGAALDVFAREPLPAESPLWDAPGVQIAPHLAGVSDTLWPDLIARFAENLGRYLAGEPLLGVVDRERGY